MNRPLARIHFDAAIIDGLARYYGNPETASRDHALENLRNRKSAFWHTASVTNAAIAELAAQANRFGSLEAALTYIEDNTGMPRPIRQEVFYDRLIPLNDAAIRELDDAYRGVGSFRSREELEARSALELARVA